MRKPCLPITATLLFMAAPAQAGDGSFGVPSSGILPPPTLTAALAQPTAAPRNDSIRRVSRTIEIPQEREPAADAGHSRPSLTPVRSAPLPAIRPNRKIRAKPQPTVDPYYIANTTRDVRAEPPRAREPAYVPPAAPAPQPAAAEQRRGLFTSAGAQMAQNAAATPVPATPAATAPAATAGGTAPDGTPCYQLRGLFTSPAHCR